jgi:hypothetical protein
MSLILTQLAILYPMMNLSLMVNFALPICKTAGLELPFANMIQYALMLAYLSFVFLNLNGVPDANIRPQGSGT